MLIAQISDLHIVGVGKKTYGIAPMGENLRLCVEHINQLSPKPDLVLVTGDITDTGLQDEFQFGKEDKFTYEEGCLSVPNQFAEIDRPKQCHVKHLDYNGHPQELKADGLLATCIQHEIDHLEGILFIDYLSKLKKEMIIKKLSKQTKESVERIVV